MLTGTSRLRSRWLAPAIWGLLLIQALPVASVSARGPLSGPTPTPRLVTSDNPPNGGGHLAEGGSTVLLPGMPAPLNPDGVVSVIDNSGGVYCSGALVGDRHVLTAAHCVDAASVNSPDRVGFDTASGLTPGPVADVLLHPLYDGTLEGGFDIAVLELVDAAPADAPRYGLYTGNNEFGVLTVKAGHGRTGHGSTGLASFDTKRRAGLNTYDATSADYNAAFGASMADGAYLLYDFDSGLEENNAWAQHGVASDLGFGVDEVNAVGGDSGGPTFLHEGGEWLIAGVTSWSVGLDTGPPDVTPSITDGSWGELSADARVSAYADFIQSVIDGSYVRPIQWGYSHGVIAPSVAWTPPGGESGPVPYHSQAFTVDSEGDYVVTSQQNFDGAIYLYAGDFDPQAPSLGLVASNDNAPDGEGGSRVAAGLTPGVEYTLVTSANTAPDAGTFRNTISGPGNTGAASSDGGFSGLLTPGEWALETPHADAGVQTDTAPGAVTLWGGNNLAAGVTAFTTTIEGATVSIAFDWTYFSTDNPGFDIFSVIAGDEITRLSDGAELSGTYEVTLAPGDPFGFQIETVDGVLGPGVATVYNLSLSLAGDYNGDGQVDLADYSTWRDTFGDTVPAGAGADGNGDGVIDAGDYTVWRDTISQMSVVAAVPEPGALSLLLLLVITLQRRP